MTLREEVCLSAARREDNWWNFVKTMEPRVGPAYRKSSSIRWDAIRHDAVPLECSSASGMLRLGGDFSIEPVGNRSQEPERDPHGEHGEPVNMPIHLSKTPNTRPVGEIGSLSASDHAASGLVGQVVDEIVHRDPVSQRCPFL
jgi:hypothetical protein